jgi:transposase-like protein
VYLDGIRFKVRDDGKVVDKCGYTVLGIDARGRKDLLGIWIGENEGSKFWMGVLNELRNRGVEDILIACVDGLKGFSEAIGAVFPDARVQRCVVHQVRASMRYVPSSAKYRFCADLKAIYNAPSADAGWEALQEMKGKWSRYAFSLEGWERNWPELSEFFQYSQPVRKLIYTTNGVESLHRQLRKATKTTSPFPHDDALVKLLWLAQRKIAKGWAQNAVPNWTEIASQLAIAFPGRLRAE